MKAGAGEVQVFARHAKDDLVDGQDADGRG